MEREKEGKKKEKEPGSFRRQPENELKDNEGKDYTTFTPGVLCSWSSSGSGVIQISCGCTGTSCRNRIVVLCSQGSRIHH